MDPFKADQFTVEEKRLLEELKLNCKNDGKEIDPKKSAVIFHKLALLYFRYSEICSTFETMIYPGS